MLFSLDPLTAYSFLMKIELVEKASLIVPDSQLLINIISQRVKQLTDNKSPFRSPLVQTMPHASVADIALMELIEGKLTWTMDTEVVFAEDDSDSFGFGSADRDEDRSDNDSDIDLDMDLSLDGDE